MYKSFSAKDYKRMLGFPDDYAVDGFIIYGGYKEFPFQQLEDSLSRSGRNYSVTRLEDEFVASIAEITVDDKKYWFTVAYGGAMLSEHMHLACLFGSKKNILIGTCGGLKKDAYNCDLIIPTWSFADDSSAKAYQPRSNGKYAANKTLSERLFKKLSPRHKTHIGPTITFQAMLAETWNDILKWSTDGYIGVEMEAATVFATSNHFNVPSAGVLVISDNLIAQETVRDTSATEKRDQRMQVTQEIFDAAVEEILNPN